MVVAGLTAARDLNAALSLFPVVSLCHSIVRNTLGPNFWGPVGRGLLLEGSWYPSMVLRPSANQKVVLRTMKTSSAKGQNWFCEPTGFYEPQWGSEWSLVSPELRPGSSLRPKCGA